MPKILPLLLLLATTAAAARTTLGASGGWAAFRDDSPRRCYAIAQPARRSVGGGAPSLSIASWPERGIARQLHVRLSTRKRHGAPIRLAIGDSSWPLIAGGADGWAPNAAADAAIVAAMRSGRSLSVETTAFNGAAMVEVYRLRGAATAIDAATLGCLRSLR